MKYIKTYENFTEAHNPNTTAHAQHIEEVNDRDEKLKLKNYLKNSTLNPTVYDENNDRSTSTREELLDPNPKKQKKVTVSAIW